MRETTSEIKKVFDKRQYFDRLDCIGCHADLQASFHCPAHTV